MKERNKVTERKWWIKLENEENEEKTEVKRKKEKQERNGE